MTPGPVSFWTCTAALQYILNCNHFGMTLDTIYVIMFICQENIHKIYTVRVFVKIISTPDEDLIFWQSGAPLHTLSKVYDVPVGFVPPPYLRQCSRRRLLYIA